MPTYINGVEIAAENEDLTDEALVLCIANATKHRDNHQSQAYGWQRTLDKLLAEAVRRSTHTVTYGSKSSGA